MVEENAPIFRGHVEDCLRRFSVLFYGKYPKGSRESTEPKRPLATFCGVSLDSVGRWLAEPDNLPVGMVYLRLMCFFDTIGFKVIDLERLKPPARRYMVELIGYGVISAEEATSQLTYSGKDVLYSVLKGKENADDEKDRKMWDMYISQKEELENKKAAVKQQFGVYFDLLDSAEAVPPVGREVSKGTLDSDLRRRYELILRLSEALNLVLEEVPAEKFSIQQLTTIGKNAPNTILRLSARLISISSGIVMDKREKEENGGR